MSRTPPPHVTDPCSKKAWADNDIWSLNRQGYNQTIQNYPGYPYGCIQPGTGIPPAQAGTSGILIIGLLVGLFYILRRK